MSKKDAIPPNAWYLSWVSFFNDIGSEMLYPVLPIFITQILGAPVFVIGIIEGLAEGAASFFKVFFGILSDKLQKRKSFVVAGYAVSATSKVLISLAYAWPLVLVARVIDKFGKGVRTGARDALLLETTNESNKGFIFGFNRAMDSMGAVIGPLVALLLLRVFNNNVRMVLYFTVIPTLFSLLLFFYVGDTKKKLKIQQINLSFSLKKLSPKFKLFLTAMVIFSLGNSSDVFLILKAKNLGLSLTLIISAYVLYNVIYSLSSVPAGKLADSIGAKKVLFVGLVIFVIVYSGFAFNTSPYLIWVLFAVYGLYIGLTDGVSKAIIGSLTTHEQAGTAYGVFYTAISIATLCASIIGGFLWSLISPASPFIFGVICALIAIGVLIVSHTKYEHTVKSAF